MKKKILAVLLGITMTLGLAGCGASSGSTVSASPQETVSQAAGSEGTSMEASAPDASSGQETPSQEEQAALSGKVVVYCPSPAGLADKMAEAFTAKTGVQVEMFQGTTGEILARLEAEKANPIADVVIMASWADGLGMIQDDQVLSYEPANTDKMNPDWVDADKKFTATARLPSVSFTTPHRLPSWMPTGRNWAATLPIRISLPFRIL